MDESQLLRGILEGCVLSVISQGETYGYEILAKLEENGFEAIFEGTLYPVITRLEKKELISCRKEKSAYGPIRKYYSITPLGKTTLDNFKESYCKINRAAEKTLFEEGSK